MKEKVVFLNVAWMKFYEGTSDEDIPVNGGSWIEENETGGEIYNFQDYNGKCYGYFMHRGKNILEKHFSDVRSTDSSVDDVLVIWVATNLDNETRIVGWYKNAKLFRDMQEQYAFTNNDYDLYYSTIANAEDCYLIPEENRSFPIERSSQSGTGTGMGRSNIWYAESDFARSILIPEVLDYINNYDGAYVNFVFTDDVIEMSLPEEEMINDYDKLFELASDCFNDEDYYFALGYLNTAKKIKETPELLYYLGNTLFYLKRFDKALDIYNILLSLDYNRKEVLYKIMFCYDLKADREKTIEYAYQILSYIKDSEDEMDEKIELYKIIFNIYFCKGDLDAAEKIVNELATKTNGENSIQSLAFMKKQLKDAYRIGEKK